MKNCTFRNDCSTCPGQVVCHCLQVTEETIQTAINALELQTVKDLREATGAGDGCTACHRRLRRYLEEASQLAHASSPSPI